MYDSKAVLPAITLPIFGKAVFRAIKRPNHSLISKDKIKGYLSVNPRDGTDPQLSP